MRQIETQNFRRINRRRAQNLYNADVPVYLCACNMNRSPHGSLLLKFSAPMLRPLSRELSMPSSTTTAMRKLDIKHSSMSGRTVRNKRTVLPTGDVSLHPH